MTAGLLHLVDRPDIVEDLRARHANVTRNDPRITQPIVGPTIFLEAAQEIERLRGMLEVQNEMITHYVQERDEARREVCSMNESGLRMNDSDKQREAKRRGWDCFKEITNV